MAAAAVFVLIAIALSAPALAKKRKGKRDGAQGGEKRIAIMASNAKPSDERPVRAQITKILKKQKIKVATKATVKAAGSAPDDDAGWMALARKMKVDGFIVPAFDKGHGKRSVELAVRSASDGAVVATESFTAKGTPKKLATAVGRAFWNKLGPSLQQVSAPAAGQEGTGMPARDLSRETADAGGAAAALDEKAPAGTETAPEETATPGPPPAPSEVAAKTDPSRAAKASSPDDAKSGEAIGETDEASGSVAGEPPGGPTPPRAPRAAHGSPSASQDNGGQDRGKDRGKDGARGPVLPALTVRVTGRLVKRSFTYTANPALPDNGTTSPTLGAAARWFPVTYVGIEASGDFASWSKFLGRYPTVTSDLTGSLVVRLPMSFGEVTGHAGAFRNVMAIQDDGTHSRTDLQLPDLVYVGARAGAGVTYRVSETVTAGAEVAYRLITNMNGGAYAITNRQYYFPNAAAGPGFDLAVSLSYRLTPIVEVQAGLDLRRYVLTTNGGSSTRISATYLTDQSYAGWLGVGGVFGGR